VTHEQELHIAAVAVVVAVAATNCTRAVAQTVH
jgi:hypothetical protein